jgi:hypothetical protein
MRRYKIEKAIRNIYVKIRPDINVETERQLSPNRYNLVILFQKIIYILNIVLCHIKGIVKKENKKEDREWIEFPKPTCNQVVSFSHVTSKNGKLRTENGKYRKVHQKSINFY